MMKSYYEIVATSKLVGFEDSPLVIEYYRDENFAYSCVWLPQNNSFIPSTIYATAYSTP